jgi:uncharacterized protein YgiM (DUF1202 family)
VKRVFARARNAVALVVSAGLLVTVAGTLPAVADTKASVTTGVNAHIAASAAASAADTSRFTKTRLNLRSGPGVSHRVLRVLAKGTRVALTGRSANGFVEVTVGSRGWVSQRYLSKSQPAAASPSSYAVEKRLTANTIRVHRAARRAFPWIKTYYGYRSGSGSDHSKGKGLDLMVPNYRTAAGKARGNQVANWAKTNHRQLRIQYVIWNQRIWNVSRAGEGWRPMASRGNDSANHKNHVHISVK